MSSSATLRQFVISSGHDFKGRFGRGREHHAVESPAVIQCVAGQGIEGDRYFGRGGSDAPGQVTFFDWAVLEAVREHFGLPALCPSVFRRNVLIEGVALPGLLGRTFSLQGVRFEGAQDCAPCVWMDEAVAPGAHAFLEGRGGLRARVLSSGALRLGAAELVLEA